MIEPGKTRNSDENKTRRVHFHCDVKQIRNKAVETTTRETFKACTPTLILILHSA